LSTVSLHEKKKGGESLKSHEDHLHRPSASGQSKDGAAAVRGSKKKKKKKKKKKRKKKNQPLSKKLRKTR